MNMNAQVVNDDNEDGVVKLNANQSKYDYVPGQVLVKFKDDNRVKVSKSRGAVSTSVGRLTSILKKYGADEMEQLLPNENPNRKMRRTRAFNGDIIQERDLSQLYRVQLSETHAHETMALVEELKDVDEVEFAEPNYLLHTLDNPPIVESYSGNPFNTQQWYLEAYGVKQLWNEHIINSERPVIAILDTGVDMTHPDLVDNLWTNTREAEGESDYDNDNNGFPGDVHGWDFINNTPDVKDFNMHGTHVAGIAAAANNNIGIIGANPQALIMPITVMQSDGTGDVATIIKGINYAVNNGATILNLSLGGYAYSQAERQALENAYHKAVIVAAAGNDGKCINTTHINDHPIPPAPIFPAAYSFVLGVQATKDAAGELANFSNFDDDGNTFSSVTTLRDPDGFNYELKAPGTDILSTVPGGKYKSMHGTSMAAPLVAGAISALKMVKLYDSQELLWGDLLHTSNIAEAFAVAQRPAELDLLKNQFQNRKDLADETEEDYSGDHEIDAGEIVSIYPVIRTTFGAASNIKLKLEMGEYEDASVVDIQTGIVDFGWHLDAYGKNVSKNPLVMKVANNVADGRHVNLKVVATCDESTETFEWPFTIVVTNMVKISGLISEDRTLTADHVYYVNENLGIKNGATLTIEPGTRLEFAEGVGISSSGQLIAKGLPGNPIVFTRHTGEGPWAGIEGNQSWDTPRDTLAYCYIDGYSHNSRPLRYQPYYKDCIIDLSDYNYWSPFSGMWGIRNNIVNSNSNSLNFSEDNYNSLRFLQHCNFVNNYFGIVDSRYSDEVVRYSRLIKDNYFNNYFECTTQGKYNGAHYALGFTSSSPENDSSTSPAYLGTSREDIIRPYIYEIGNAPTYGAVVLNNMPSRPYAEAHGIVWKVVVNGKDAQDEYEDLAPLGMGRQKFEVYFNRPMNKAVAPQISFGVRDPWTQHAVAEDGSWNEDGTIYTAYTTITGKTKSDGMNRIYVRGAEDNEYFEIPYEKTRFNINVQAAGSMASGFAAEAGMGRVNLTWNNEHNNFEDAMGFNIYRYSDDVTKTIPEHYDYDLREWIPATEVPDTIRLNQEIVDIETTNYTDYEVTPGNTYYYMYKVLSTDLQEYDVSNVVAATPLTSQKGDANGDNAVDVSDVITTVNYAAGMNPKPFIFEAADMNVDQIIDILDIVGIIQKIIINSSATTAVAEPEAVYTIEDGTVYVESPVAMAGVQVQLSGPSCLNDNGQMTNDNYTVAKDLDGFEQVSAWLSDNDYLFLAYNMNGETLAPGKHALLHIGDAEIASIRLADISGKNIVAVNGEGQNTTGIDRLGRDVMKVKGVYNLNGQKLSGSVEQMKRLPKGVYIINGQKVVK